VDKLGKERWAGAIAAYRKGLPDYLERSLADMSAGGLEKSAETAPILYAKAADHLNGLSRGLLALIVEYWKKDPPKDPHIAAEAQAKLYTDAIAQETAKTEVAVKAVIKNRILDDSAEDKGREYLEDMSQSLSKDGAAVIEKLWRETNSGLRKVDEKKDERRRIIRRETRQLFWACLISAIAAGGAASSFFMKKAREDARQMEMMRQTLSSLNVDHEKLVQLKIKNIGQIKEDIKDVEAELTAEKARIRKEFEERVRKLKIKRANQGLPVKGKNYEASLVKINDELKAALDKAASAAQKKINQLNNQKPD
jgi:hypothetical protein